MRALRLAGLVLALLSAATPAAAEGNPIFLTVGERVSTPRQWAEFCRRGAAICNEPALHPVDIMLAPQVWSDSRLVNSRVNDAVIGKSDEAQYGVDDYWTYPDSGYGDCEDYVLEKQRQLMQMGYPRQALLHTIVYERDGNGHAVLVVKTNRGEFVLDNRRRGIYLWHELPYRFVKRQSQEDPNAWVRLSDPRLVAHAGR